MSHADDALKNRVVWTKANAEYTDRRARQAWAQEEIDWGMFSGPESEIGALGEVEQERFRFLERGITRGLVRGFLRLRDEPVVFRIRPTSLVVAVGAHPNVQERIGIVVVSDPGRAADLVIHLPARIEINLLLLVHHRNYIGV
jgi:hypothetical protein